ncbi:MAG: SirB2 family protein [Xanthomonadales bacterium]|nr:SirB2 family protein [Xanthomonadaceae bacterium]MBN8224468.1 SirB2 family protein [Xanthomonadales bacterium]MCA0197050.1 SirB2 family protein [Pseudomonadota bacterium]HRF83802.1 SirB2 family protein [Pseudoxanthomonas sp.]
MLAFYPQIKMVHVAAVSLSGAFFALRALGLLAGMRWPRLAPVRYLSYTIDTTLLTAAMMLLTILPGELYANGWLWVKLALVATYIVLGILAFHPGRSAKARWALVAAAGLCFLQAYTIARFHHPLGALLLLGS